MSVVFNDGGKSRVSHRMMEIRSEDEGREQSISMTQPGFYEDMHCLSVLVT